MNDSNEETLKKNIFRWKEFYLHRIDEYQKEMEAPGITKQYYYFLEEAIDDLKRKIKLLDLVLSGSDPSSF